MCVCVRMELAGLEYKWEACSLDPMLPLFLSWMASPQVCGSTVNTLIFTGRVLTGAIKSLSEKKFTVDQV